MFRSTAAAGAAAAAAAAAEGPWSPSRFFPGRAQLLRGSHGAPRSTAERKTTVIHRFQHFDWRANMLPSLVVWRERGGEATLWGGPPFAWLVLGSRSAIFCCDSAACGCYKGPGTPPPWTCLSLDSHPPVPSSVFSFLFSEIPFDFALRITTGHLLLACLFTSIRIFSRARSHLISRVHFHNPASTYLERA